MNYHRRHNPIHQLSEIKKNYYSTPAGTTERRLMETTENFKTEEEE
jgi:hypothetical protein